MCSRSATQCRAPRSPPQPAGRSVTRAAPRRWVGRSSEASKGGYVPDIIVLLTDGANNRGITPLQAVPYAVARRVRIYTIGFGTTHIAPFKCTPQQQGGIASNGGFGPGGGFGGGGYGGGPYGGGGFGIPGGGSPLVADLPPLRQVSQLTGGVSFSAKDAPELSKVFANLPKHVAVQKQRHEVSSTFALIGGFLALLALGASIRWGPALREPAGPRSTSKARVAKLPGPRARATAWLRLVTPSLRKTPFRWVRTVFSLTSIASAMARFASPCASRARVSLSLAVRPQFEPATGQQTRRSQTPAR